MNNSRRRTHLATAGVLVGAPITAEYLQAYLTSTGDLIELAFGLMIFAPLYGGAALVIREVAVRTGRGWPGVLLLAGAFGVAMTGLVDLSLFTELRDYPGWHDLWAPTEVLGLSVHAGIAWSLGHVVMSIGVPLALLDALAPRTRGRSMLGRPGLVAMTVLWLTAAAFVHLDARGPGSTPTLGQAVGVVVLCGALAIIALSRVGAARPRRLHRPAWITATAVSVGFATMLAIDLPPATWLGLGIVLVVVGALAALTVRAARSAAWGRPQVTAVACGALVERALVGFLSPLPPEVDAVAKNLQSVVLLLGVLVVVWFALRGGRAHADVASPVVSVGA